MRLTVSFALVLLSPTLWTMPAAQAQNAALSAGAPTGLALDGSRLDLSLSVDEAVQIGLERGYAVRLAGLDVETARSQVAEAYGGLLPRVEGSSSYTRNVAQANPFAGSSAASLFSGGAATGWLQFNELARQDGDPATLPITLDEYNRRVGEGQSAAGYNPANPANPFGTDNQITNTLSITQPLFSPSAFAAVKGARSLVAVNEAGAAQQRDEAAHQVRQLYYQAALARAQTDVLEGSLRRTGATYDDAVVLVAQGVRPMLEQLNAEVDVANARTELVAARAQSAAATDQLLLALGLPVGARVRLTTPLAVPGDALFEVDALQALLAREADAPTPTDRLFQPGELPADASIADALAADALLADRAVLDARPDVRQAVLAVELQEVQRQVTRAATLPGLSAFANLSYSGNVPDDRTSVFTPDPADPFTFASDTPGFFDDAYWQPAVAVGVRLNWTLFDGFQTRRRVQQDRLALDRAEIQLEQARSAAALEVSAAARELWSARERLRAQERTARTAETAYRFATERLEVGVAPLLDVRLASDNLERSRLALLQAAYDALVARSAYARATGDAGAVPTAPPARPALPTTSAAASAAGLR